MARIDVGICNFPLIHRHFQTEAFLAFRIVRSKILPVQPTKLETLDDLLAQAEHYAGFCMRNKRKDVAHAALVHQLMNQDINLMSKVVETNMFA